MSNRTVFHRHRDGGVGQVQLAGGDVGPVARPVSSRHPGTSASCSSVVQPRSRRADRGRTWNLVELTDSGASCACCHAAGEPGVWRTTLPSLSSSSRRIVAGACGHETTSSSSSPSSATSAATSRPELPDQPGATWQPGSPEMMRDATGALDAAWHTSRVPRLGLTNVKASHQRYIGWYGGTRPPVAASAGGSLRSAAVDIGGWMPRRRRSTRTRRPTVRGRLGSHAVFADPNNRRPAQFHNQKCPHPARLCGGMRNVAQLPTNQLRGARATVADRVWSQVGWPLRFHHHATVRRHEISSEAWDAKLSIRWNFAIPVSSPRGTVNSALIHHPRAERTLRTSSSLTRVGPAVAPQRRNDRSGRRNTAHSTLMSLTDRPTGFAHRHAVDGDRRMS